MSACPCLAAKFTTQNWNQPGAAAPRTSACLRFAPALRPAPRGARREPGPRSWARSPGPEAGARHPARFAVFCPAVFPGFPAAWTNLRRICAADGPGSWPVPQPVRVLFALICRHGSGPPQALFPRLGPRSRRDRGENRIPKTSAADPHRHRAPTLCDSTINFFTAWNGGSLLACSRGTRAARGREPVECPRLTEARLVEPGT